MSSNCQFSCQVFAFPPKAEYHSILLTLMLTLPSWCHIRICGTEREQLPEKNMSFHPRPSRLHCSLEKTGFWIEITLLTYWLFCSAINILDQRGCKRNVAELIAPLQAYPFHYNFSKYLVNSVLLLIISNTYPSLPWLLANTNNCNTVNCLR